MGDGAGDAPPSNTASPNSIESDPQILRFGVDSLYLSYSGKLSDEVARQLVERKALAQSEDVRERAKAQYAVGDHCFEVRDRGAGLFPYVLDDGHFRVQLARAGTQLPMAYGKVSSGFLAQVGPNRAGEHLDQVVSSLGTVEGFARVSRIDVFVDFATRVQMDSWDRHAWVTRAKAISQYAIDSRFTGWAVGQGGHLSARLYDKLLEIAKSGKTYLLDLWMRAGWDAITPVWRLEFQLKREVLGEYTLVHLRDVLPNLTGIWRYCTTDWLRLSIPSETDATRARWPTHPLWQALSNVDFSGDGGPLDRRREPTRAPSDDRLFSIGLSVITAFMAREGISNFERGVEEYFFRLRNFHEEKSHSLGLSFESYIERKVATKRREYNTGLNDPEFEARQKALARERATEEYRRASRGG